jgi:hypothetical protein
VYWYHLIKQPPLNFGIEPSPYVKEMVIINDNIMAIAKFKRFTESGKSALILVKANKFVMGYTPAYVPADACEGMVEDESFEIPDGFILVDMVDTETGEVRKANDGSHLRTLQY